MHKHEIFIYIYIYKILCYYVFIYIYIHEFTKTVETEWCVYNYKSVNSNVLIAGFMFISIWEGRNPWQVFKQAQLNDTLTKDLHAVAGLLFHLSHCELKSVPSKKKGVRCHNLNPLGMAPLFSLSKCSSGHTAGRANGEADHVGIVDFNSTQAAVKPPQKWNTL